MSDKWSLRIGNSLKFCIDANGNIATLKNGSFLMTEDEALKEAHKRSKEIIFYLVPENGAQITRWNNK